MNQGKYIFSQICDFLPKNQFDWFVKKYQGNKYVKKFTCWNHLRGSYLCSRGSASRIQRYSVKLQITNYKLQMMQSDERIRDVKLYYIIIIYIL